MNEPIPPQLEEYSDDAEQGVWRDLREWMRNQLPWWSMSFTVHIAALASLLLLGRFAMTPTPQNDVATFAPVERFDEPNQIIESVPPDPVGDEIPRPINVEIPPDPVGMPDAPPAPAGLGQTGAPDGIDQPAIGHQNTIGDPGAWVPKQPGSGAGNDGGSLFQGPPGDPYAARNKPPGVGRVGGGPTPDSEHAVAAAIYWLAAHQSRDGSWSLQDYLKMCRDKTCTGPGAQESLSAATAMGVLPFLGAGITQNSKSKFQSNVQRAIYWLVNHQKPDGDLSAGASQQMYSHALATIAVCEAYGMTKDKVVGTAAQKAINFIVAAQNAKTGAWRYHPGEEGDTSVTGWQMMALRSGQIAKLNVPPAVFAGVNRWLSSVAKAAPGEGSSGSGQFSYQPDGAATPTMSAVGLLCSQYLRAGRGDPVIVGGVRYLMANQPTREAQNIYYWYYAAQVMHNMNDADWDKWNRAMRGILVSTQVREGCATGSWDPDKPVRDAWGPTGGRVMMTGLSALTLEVYYRFLPLYQKAD